MDGSGASQAEVRAPAEPSMSWPVKILLLTTLMLYAALAFSLYTLLAFLF